MEDKYGKEEMCSCGGKCEGICRETRDKRAKTQTCPAYYVSEKKKGRTP